MLGNYVAYTLWILTVSELDKPDALASKLSSRNIVSEKSFELREFLLIRLPRANRWREAANSSPKTD
jgi:hypothetical protein